MEIVVAPGRIGGLAAPSVADAMAEAWRTVRPDDVVTRRPLGHGGAGTLDLFGLDDLPTMQVGGAPSMSPTGLAPTRTAPPPGLAPGRQLVAVEVVDTRGHPTQAEMVLDSTLRRATAWIEAARVAADGDRRDPDDLGGSTSWGVGQLVAVALELGARRIVVAPGDLAAADGGAGALAALGHRLRVADGSGLKVGAGTLGRVCSVERTWVPDSGDVELVVAADTAKCLADLGDAGGLPEAVLAGLATWIAVVARDLDGGDLARRPGSAAGGGLAFALAAGLGADVRVGAAVLADDLRLDSCLRGARRVLTVGPGPGQAESTSIAAQVRSRAATFGVPASVVPDPGGEGTQAIEAVARAVAGLAQATDQRGTAVESREHPR